MSKIQHGLEPFRGRKQRKQQWAGSRMGGWRGCCEGSSYIIPFSRAGKQAPAWPSPLGQQTQPQSRGGSPALGHLPGESAIKSTAFLCSNAQIAFPIKKVSLIISQQTANLCSSSNITGGDRGTGCEGSSGQLHLLGAELKLFLSQPQPRARGSTWESSNTLCPPSMVPHMIQLLHSSVNDTALF